MDAPQKTLTLTDPRALRALAHPIRLKLVGLLRTQGPLTATQAGQLLGQVPASCLVSPAPAGQVRAGRGGTRRPWPRAALAGHRPFHQLVGGGRRRRDDGRRPMLSSVVAERYAEQLLDWLAERPDQPLEWQQAAMFGDLALYVTAQELRELSERLHAVLEPYLPRTVDPDQRPDGSRLVTFIQLAFPTAAPDAR